MAVKALSHCRKKHNVMAHCFARCDVDGMCFNKPAGLNPVEAQCTLSMACLDGKILTPRLEKASIRPRACFFFNLSAAGKAVKDNLNVVRAL